MRAVVPPGLSFDEYWRLQAMQSFDNEGYSRARIIVGKTLRTIGVPT